MKSVEARFKRIQKQNPSWSSISSFCEAVARQNFNPVIISRWFNKLVDKDDYLKSDKKYIMNYLRDITKPCEACQKLGQTRYEKRDLSLTRYSSHEIQKQEA